MSQGYRRWKEVLSEEAPAVERLRAPAQPSSDTSGLAIASLVLGIVAFITGPLTGLPAIVCGHVSLRRIFKSGGAIAGGGLAIAGLVTGYVATVLGVVAIVYMTVIVPEEERRLAEQTARAAQELIRVPGEMLSKMLPEPRQAFRPVRTPSFYDPRGPVQQPYSSVNRAQKVDLAEEIEKNEAAVVGILEEIVSAEKSYRGTHGRYVGSVKPLQIAGMIDDSYAGYSIKILASSSSFRITAEPVVPGQTGVRTFYVDDSGAMRSSDGGNALNWNRR